MRGQSRVNEMNTLPIYYNIRHVNCHTLRDGQQIFHISREAILFCCRSDVFLARPRPGTSSHSSPSDSQLAVLSDEQTRLTRGDHSHVTSESGPRVCGHNILPWWLLWEHEGTGAGPGDGWGWSLLVACLHLVITGIRRGIQITDRQTRQI